MDTTLLTLQRLPAQQIWEQYTGRADAKNSIEELQHDFGGDGFCMDAFYATEEALSMVMIACNLMALYGLFSQQTTKLQRLSTLICNCFAVGKRIIKKGRNPTEKFGFTINFVH